MKTTQKQTVEVNFAHEEIIEWAKGEARKEIQRVVGTKKTVDPAGLHVYITSSGPGQSGQPSRYEVRVTYNDERADAPKEPFIPFQE